MKFMYSLLFTLCFVTAGIAQDAFYVKYNLDIDASGENAKMMQGMFQGSTLELASDAERTWVETKKGTMMTMTLEMNLESKEMTMFMIMMGQNMAYRGDADEYDNEEAEKPKVELINETKVILGETCKKAIIKNPGGEVVNYWYTENFKRPEGMKQMPNEIPGLCLEFEGFTQGMKMTYTATEFTDKANMDDYKLTIPEGVEIQPIKDMKGVGGN